MCVVGYLGGRWQRDRQRNVRQQRSERRCTVAPLLQRSRQPVRRSLWQAYLHHPARLPFIATTISSYICARVLNSALYSPARPVKPKNHPHLSHPSLPAPFSRSVPLNAPKTPHTGAHLYSSLNALRLLAPSHSFAHPIRSVVSYV